MAKISFYNPKFQGQNLEFGGATLGFAGKPDSKADAFFDFSLEISGDILCGSYEEILAKIPQKSYKAAIVLCGNKGGENEFVKNLYDRINCIIVGGGAAMDGNKGGLITGNSQAAVLFIDDENYDVAAETKNIHSHVLETVKVDFDAENKRVVKAINGENPKQWLDCQKKKLGIDVEDFEHFTLSDTLGVNAHLSFDGENVFSGRDLENEMIARYVKPQEVYDSVFEFYNDNENAIVFGCAGIKGITGEITSVDSLGLYMYGEICSVENSAVFGNLMLSKIKFVKKYF